MIAAAPTLQPELSFSEDDHVYKWRGTIIPGVTSMLSKCGLVDSAWFHEQAAIRGQAVHAAIHLYNEGRLDWDSLSDEIAPYLVQWIEFCAAHKVETIYSEVRLVSAADMFGGTVDWIGLVDDDTKLIDFKTMLKPRRAAPWWAIQLALYRRLVSESLNIAPPQSMNLILTPETYRLARPAITTAESHEASLAVITLSKLKGR